MPLDPYAKRFLDMLGAAAHDKRAPMSFVERRDTFAKLMRLGGPAPAIGRVEDLTMPGTEVPVRVYTPADATPPSATPASAPEAVLPGLMFIHGGGLVAGSLDTHDTLCRILAAETGCRVMSVDYRLAPEHRFPAALDDCLAVVDRVLERPETLGLDPTRIGIGGDSAGAALAAIVGSSMRSGESSPLVFQLLLCPITDFAADTESRRIYDGCLLDAATMARELDAYLPAGIEATDPLVSPLRAIDVAGLPPVFIHTAECDPMRDEGTAYAERLAAAGVPVHLTRHPGMIHLFYALGGIIPYARTALPRIGAEIRALLA